jgi:DNA-binding FadR family transcriptional regulator
VAEASANPLLREYSANARDLCQALRQRDALDDRASIECGHAHVRIADAIAARRAALASEAMLNHVNYVRDRALGAFQGEVGGL